MKIPFIVLTPQNMPMEAPFEDAAYNYSNTYNTRAILKNGGMPIIPTFLSEEQALELMERADGLFMTGGADINPALYKEEVMDCCGKIEFDRDDSDIALMKAALKLKKPILCICRGAQLGNVVFGGSMYQDLPTQRKSDVVHSDYADRENGTHIVNIVEGTPLHKLLGVDTIGVNTLHHQATKDIAPGVVPMAFAEDGLLESWYYDSEDQWIRAYQWHPEMMAPCGHNDAIIKDFIRQCIKEMK